MDAGVTYERIKSVEFVISWIVVTCAEVIHLQVIVILLACVEQFSRSITRSNAGIRPNNRFRLGSSTNYIKQNHSADF